MEVKLIVVGGKASKGEVALKLPAIIGRGREATLTVAHPLVSRRHCELFEVDGLLMVRDLGSLNGTLVGQRRITEAPLWPGGQFTIGPLTFNITYDYQGDPDAVPEPVLAEDQRPGPAVDADRQIAEVRAEEPMVSITSQPSAGSAGEGRPDFSFMEATDAEVSEAELVDGNVWDRFTDETLPDDAEDEKEPEPTPPPNLRKRERKKPAAEAVVESAAEAEPAKMQAAVQPPEPPAEVPRPRAAAEASAAAPPEAAPVEQQQPASQTGVPQQKPSEASEELQAEASGQQEQTACEPVEEPDVAEVDRVEVTAEGPQSDPPPVPKAPTAEVPEPAKKKKGFWPFGRGNKKGKGAAPAEAAPPSMPSSAPVEPHPGEAQPRQEAPRTTAESEKVDALPDFLAGVEPGQQQAAPAETDDDALKEFLKGFQ